MYHPIKIIINRLKSKRYHTILHPKPDRDCVSILDNNMIKLVDLQMLQMLGKQDKSMNRFLPRICQDKK